MIILSLILFIALLIKCYNSLTIYQQSHYNNKYYLRYYFYRSIYDIPIVLISIILISTNNLNIKLSSSIYLLLYELIITRNYKKKLKLTKRIYRLIIILIPYLILNIFLFIYPLFNYGIILCFIISNLLESIINKKYLNKAIVKRTYFKKDVVAITGSFGKTTTKIFMACILDSLKPFYTQESYNTPMGISLSINHEELNLYNLLILEFGASKRNDIAYLMKCFKPNIAVVTSVGYMHLNTFKSIENIVNEKMKIVEMLNNGLVILNYDNDYIRKYKIKTKQHIISYGYKNGDIIIKKDTSIFSIYYLGIYIDSFNHKALSDIEILDLIPGLILALLYKIDKNEIQKRILSLKRPKSRLEIKKFDKLTVINDAFNSNLEGALTALDTLKRSSGIKFLITPGFVENDKVLNKLYISYSMRIKESVDYAFIIHSKTGDILYKYLNSNKCFLVNSFNEAYNLSIQAFKGVNKTILIENDMLDINENRLFN